jgi:hypothetical protein
MEFYYIDFFIARIGAYGLLSLPESTIWLRKCYELAFHKSPQRNSINSFG